MPFDAPPRRAPVAAAQILVRGDTAIASRFMAAVYRWMTLGLAVTALVAYAVAGSDALVSIVLGNRFVFYGLLLGELALVFAISASATRLSAAAAGGLFLLYAALNGATLSVVLLAYTGSSVALAFVSTAATFGTMSVYGTVTRRDLSSWGSFLFMGLVGVVIASLVNMFLGSSVVAFVVSCASVVVFTGLAAYDTQKLGALATPSARCDRLTRRGGARSADAGTSLP